MSLVSRTRRSVYVAARSRVEARVPHLPPALLTRLHGRRVRAIVEHAYRWVPHYRQALDALGLRPTDFRTGADLAALPLIEGEDLKRHPERFLARDRPPEDHQLTGSSGTSGAPLNLYRDRSSQVNGFSRSQRRWSIVQRHAGRRRFRCSAIVAPDSAVGQATASHRERLIGLRYREGAFQQLSIWDPPDVNIPLLNDFRPHVIASYGSYVEALYLHARRTGARLHRPSAIVYGGDAVSDGFCHYARDELGVLVQGNYGAVEVPGTAFECERGTGMHVNVDAVHLRIVRPDGESAPAGEYGDVVVSNLTNRATVLLNYRLGDRAALLPDPCPCGRALPLMSYVEGRSDDWIRRPDGTLVHPYTASPVFHREPAVWEWQLVQREPGHAEVLLVSTEEGGREELANRLTARLVERLGGQVEVRFVDKIPRSPAGKRKAVVRL